MHKSYKLHACVSTVFEADNAFAANRIATRIQERQLHAARTATQPEGQSAVGEWKLAEVGEDSDRLIRMSKQSIWWQSFTAITGAVLGLTLVYVGLHESTFWEFLLGGLILLRETREAVVHRG